MSKSLSSLNYILAAMYQIPKTCSKIDIEIFSTINRTMKQAKIYMYNSFPATLIEDESTLF